jgi:plastocyanin
MLYSLLRVARIAACFCFFALLSNQSRAANVSVTVNNNFFNPPNITVNVGDTVTWVWIGSGHDTVATDGTWNSGLKNAPATFPFTFTAAHAGKRFDYFCTPHRSLGMVGSVTVRAAANQPPTVSLTAPGNGATFLTTDQITFSANASDPDGTISKVEFLSDGSLIGAADTTSPYSVTASLPAGQHTITAKATDNTGAATTSGSVTITVNAPNQPPTVSLTAPANGQTFLTTDSITFSADANDDAGVNRVEFLSDGTVIGTDTSAPYSISVSLPAGQHTITARAFDGPGLSTTTSGITITVNAPQNNPPTITLSSPQSAQVSKAPATISLSATATDDSGVTQVEFFQDGVSFGSDTSAPYETTVQNLAAGVYNFTAVAHDNGGLATASTPVQIRIAAEPHIDSITVNGSVVTVTATATTGINHDLEATSDFLGWTVVNSATAANGSVTLHDTVVAANRFYRVVAR